MTPESNEENTTPRNSLPGPHGAAKFTVVACPSPALLSTNCLVVHRSDLDLGIHVMVNNRFPLTTTHDNTGKLEPGQVGASACQREWMRLAVGNKVTISSLATPQVDICVGSLDLEVSLWTSRALNPTEFSTIEMAQSFVKQFDGKIFARDQQLVFSFREQDLKVMVKGLIILELAPVQQKGPPAHTGIGVLMEATELTFKTFDNRIKIISDANQASSNSILVPNFKFADMGLGGLDTEFSAIFRRAFMSRQLTPKLVKELGIQHVKGILLFGPPGTGKTLLAREIGKMLNNREPKVVNGPEILNKFVGSSEKNIRDLFVEAEKEEIQKGEESGLHVIIFDELDAICKQRGSGGEGGSGVGDSVVNQLLGMMDGVHQLNNILLIGMTNRKDMIDEALLRPGRLEVHMEISLPNESGRFQILNIHTSKMKNSGRMDADVDLEELAVRTKNFSGAEIAGLVRSAQSFALGRHFKVETKARISDEAQNVQVNKDDFMKALDEVHPAFGVSEEELQRVIQKGIINFDDNIAALLHEGLLSTEQVRTSTQTSLVSIVLHGPPGSGKSALAAEIARKSQFPFIKIVSPDNMAGFGVAQKVAAINKLFADSYKSPLSVVVIDSIERLLGWASVRNQLYFSNDILQHLLVLLQRRPPKGHRLLVIVTAVDNILTELEVSHIFDTVLYVPPISTLTSLKHVLSAVDHFSNAEQQRALEMLSQAGFGSSQGDDVEQPKLKIGIRKLLSIIDKAKQEPEDAVQKLVEAVVKPSNQTG